MGDIYPFAELDRCMVPDCECPMRPIKTEIQALDGSVFLWVCPCHFLMTLGAIATVVIGGKSDE